MGKQDELSVDDILREALDLHAGRKNPQTITSRSDEEVKREIGDDPMWLAGQIQQVIDRHYPTADKTITMPEHIDDLYANTADHLAELGDKRNRRKDKAHKAFVKDLNSMRRRSRNERE